MKKLIILCFSSTALFITSCNKAEAPPPGPTAYFPQVKEIIQENCISCHYQGGEGAPVILTADSDIVNHAAGIKAATCDSPTMFNKRMPPGGELSDGDKTIITKWFESGGTSADLQLQAPKK